MPAWKPGQDANIARQGDVASRNTGQAYQPVLHAPPGYTSDSTSGISIVGVAVDDTLTLAGTNANRVYLFIQNNSAGSNLAISFGSPYNLGIIITPGQYYERQFYCPIQPVYATVLAAAGVSGDYVTVDEGSWQT